LQIEPEAGINAKESPQANRCVRGHVTALANDVANSVSGNANGPAKLGRRKAERVHVFLGKDLAGMSANARHDDPPQ
jgi:hypothetical protein